MEGVDQYHSSKAVHENRTEPQRAFQWSERQHHSAEHVLGDKGFPFRKAFVESHRLEQLSSISQHLGPCLQKAPPFHQRRLDSLVKAMVDELVAKYHNPAARELLMV
jgi:hypothetical protein